MHSALGTDHQFQTDQNVVDDSINPSTITNLHAWINDPHLQAGKLVDVVSIEINCKTETHLKKGTFWKRLKTLCTPVLRTKNDILNCTYHQT